MSFFWAAERDKEKRRTRKEEDCEIYFRPKTGLK